MKLLVIYEFKNLSDDQLFEIYPKLLKELKSRKLIRANNLVGEWQNVLL